MPLELGRLSRGPTFSSPGDGLHPVPTDLGFRPLLSPCVLRPSRVEGRGQCTAPVSHVLFWMKCSRQKSFILQAWGVFNIFLTCT